MKKSSFFAAAHLFILASSASMAAHASLINNQDGSFTDTNTGYLWRTLAQYDGMDFASATAMLPFGYNPATEAQLATLTADVTASSIDFPTLLSTLGTAPGSDILWGFYNDGTRYAWLADGDQLWNSNAANNYGWTNWGYEVTPDVAFTGLSLFAVETAPPASTYASVPASVPEPGTLALVSAAPLLLLARRRRKS